MRAKSILLVDDEDSILKSFRKEFEQVGYRVTTASCGEEAVEILSNDHFDMVFTDLVMPGMGGITVLQQAKKQDADICAIVLTGYGDLTTAIDALRLGADEYLLKPCDVEEVLLRVAKCFEKQEAFRKVKLYENILSICMYCKSIKDESNTALGQDKWLSMEKYLHHKSDIDVSHGLCPDCYRKEKEKLTAQAQSGRL